MIPPKTRVTLHFPEQSFEGAEPVDPAAPRTEGGYYWGFQVRKCNSLSSVFTESPWEEGYDVSIGTFIISAHETGYEDVAESPKLPRVRPDHWSLILDEMRINGEAFAFNKSSVPGVPQGKVIAVLDTGFSLPPLPQAAVDAIYSKIPGAAFWNSPIINSWIIPCNSSTDLSFYFGYVVQCSSVASVR